jgi:porin
MNFGLGNGALFIGEVQYALNPPPANPADASSPGLPGTFLPAVRRHTAT